MRIGSFTFAIAAAGILLASAASSKAEDSVRLGALEIQSVWARATPPAAKTGAAYLAIRNRGEAADRLIGVASPVAATVELHGHEMEGQMMRMRALADVTIPAGGEAALQAGGGHVMLIGLAAPLRAGETFPLTLRFAKAGEITVQVPVRRDPPAAQGGHGHPPAR
ncbi:MAG: copper chaperone PCu(A)C [Rhodospirillales bacterium]|nr:copper chaperone PCu(A)C [Rhodospirillales bacterium]